MSYLLDTHALLWFLEGDPRLPEATRTLLASEKHEFFVIFASFWELSIKASLGKISLSNTPSAMMQRMPTIGFSVLDLAPTYLQVLENLPFHHRDPFDRLLIATALAEKLDFISGDQAIRRYHGISITW